MGLDDDEPQIPPLSLDRLYKALAEGSRSISSVSISGDDADTQRVETMVRTVYTHSSMEALLSTSSSAGQGGATQAIVLITKDTEFDPTRFASSLASNHSLKHLRIDMSALADMIDGDHVSLIGEAISSSAVMSLSLRGLTNQHAQALFSRLHLSQTLSSIELSHACLNDISSIALSKLLQRSLAIQSMHFSKIGFTCESGLNSFHLPSALPFCTNLRYIVIDGYTADEAMIELIQACCEVPNLMRFRLSQSPLYSPDPVESLHETVIKALSQNISKAKHLEELIVRGHKLGDNSVRLLSSSLPPSLRRLDLYRNSFKQAGSLFSLRSAPSSSQAVISSINLGSNRLSPRTVDVIAEFLRDPMCRLEHLQLNICDMQTSSLNRLASALSLNRSLLDLDVSRNQDVALPAFTEALRLNHTIQCLGMSGRDALGRRLPRDHIAQLEEVLEHQNQSLLRINWRPALDRYSKPLERYLQRNCRSHGDRVREACLAAITANVAKSLFDPNIVHIVLAMINYAN